MARGISARERALLLGTAVLLGVFLLARPYFSRIGELGPGAGRLLEDKAAVIVAYREAVGREAGLRAEAAAIGARIAAHESVLLPGATPPLAAADLQTRLKKLADVAGLKIQSEKILAHVKRDAYLEIPVQIVATGDIRTLKNFIVAVESSEFLVSVQDLTLRAVKRRQFVPETRAYTEISDLQASMTLVGLIRSERG